MMLRSCAFVFFVSFVWSSSSPAQNRVVEGRVTRPSESGRPVGVARQWVVLHRVGTTGGAPVDSTRTARDGRYRITYRADADPDALYFVSSRYADIAYFSPPLRGARVTGGDGDVIVYETTADASKLNVQGRHLVVSAPRGGRREIAEIFELENPGTQTVVARDSTSPIWWTPLPARAESASVAPSGDITAGAVVFRDGRAEIYAPMSPGVRQVALTYLLDADAFPLSVPLQRKSGLLEVLLEEPRSSVEGAGLAEVAPATIEGRQFRRYLAQDAAANSVMRVSAPEPVQQTRRGLAWLGVGSALAMLTAAALWFGRNRKVIGAANRPRISQSESERLVAAIAVLDAQFERTPTDRASYDARRAELKSQLTSALAAEKELA